MRQGRVTAMIQSVMDSLRRSGGIYTDTVENKTYLILKMSKYGYPNLVDEEQIRYCFTPNSRKNEGVCKDNIVVIVCRGAQKTIFPDMHVVGTDQTRDRRGKIHNRWILKQQVIEEDDTADDYEPPIPTVGTQEIVVAEDPKYRSPNEHQLGKFFGKCADHEACSYRLKPDMIYTPDFTYIALYNKSPWILELKTSHFQFDDIVREKCRLLTIKTGIPVFLMAGNGREICGIKFDPETGKEVPNKMYRPVYSPIFGIGWTDTNHKMDLETTARWDKCGL